MAINLFSNSSPKQIYDSTSQQHRCCLMSMNDYIHIWYLLCLCRSLKTGSMWPWWSIVSSCGSLCWCVSSGRWASSCSLSFRVTTPPSLMTWTVTEIWKPELWSQCDPELNFDSLPRETELWQHFMKSHVPLAAHTHWEMMIMHFISLPQPAPFLTSASHPSSSSTCLVILFSTHLSEGLGLIHFTRLHGQFWFTTTCVTFDSLLTIDERTGMMRATSSKPAVFKVILLAVRHRRETWTWIRGNSTQIIQIKQETLT